MDTAIRKKIPIGTEDFVKIRTEGYFYVDKTALIRDLLWDGGAVTLFTRPRRFGKTLNMGMLKAFFEIGCDPSLFEGLEIAEEKGLCEKYMGYAALCSSPRNLTELLILWPKSYCPN